MAYETKVILTLLAEALVRAENVKEAYGLLVRAANAEGLKLPSYKELKEMVEQEKAGE